MPVAFDSILSDPERLAALHEADVLESSPDAHFDRLAQLAARVLNVPVVLVSFVAADRQVFKAIVGLHELRETSPLHSFCQQVVASGERLVVSDAREHHLWDDSPAFDNVGMIAFAGTPVTTATGLRLGAFCAIDHQLRAWTARDVEIIEDLASAASTEIDRRLTSHALKQERAAKREILERVAREETIYAREIVERKRAERAIVQSQARLYSIMHSAHDAILTLDEALTVTYSNAAAERLFQFQSVNVLGCDIRAFVPERLQEAYLALVRELSTSAAGTRPTGLLETFTLRRSNGCEFPAELSVSLSRANDRSYFTVMIRDISERMRAEEAQRETYEWLEQALSGSEIGLWDWDLGSDVMRCSDRLCEMLGKPVSRLTNARHAWLSGIHRDDRADVERGLLENAAGRTPYYKGVYRLSTSEGTWKWFMASGTVLTRDDQGHALRVVGTLVDISGSKHAEDALRRSEYRYRSVVENAGSVIIGLSPAGEIFEWNVAAETLFGLRRQEALGRNYVECFVPRERRESVRGDLGRVLSGSALPTYSGDVLTVDGERRTVIWNVTRTAVEESAVEGVIVMGQDITERKWSDERFRALFEQSSDAHLLFDEDGGVLDCNPATLVMLRAPDREGVLGRNPGSMSPLLQPDGEPSREKARTMSQRAREQGCHRFEWVHQRFDGEELTVEVTLTVVTLHGKAVLMAVWHDLTARLRGERALRQAKESAEAANRAKSDFLARMSHELRTPLNSVIGFANLLKRNPRGALTVQELTFLDRIGANGVHLLSLINDVLDLAKIEAGHLAVDIAPFDVLALVRETIGELEGQAKEKRVLLVTELPHPLAPLHGDRSKLKQVIINLVGNALKFTVRGSVILRVLHDDSGTVPVAIEVEDTGIGIPADRLDVIFEAFEQAESSTSRRFGGTGLGLAISRELCEKMGYQLRVGSTVGSGSTFVIQFPAA